MLIVWGSATVGGKSTPPEVNRADHPDHLSPSPGGRSTQRSLQQ
jgi:hypothetical protein